MNVICETEPVEHGLSGHGWTLKKLRRWLKQVMNCDLARSTLHRILQAARLRWKKCQKVLKKADPQKRAAFMERFQELYEQLCRQQIVWSILMKPTSTAIWTWATPGPKRTRLPGV